MKKSFVLMLTLVLTLVAGFSFGSTALATAKGHWQCTICGQRQWIQSTSTVLPSRDMFDGHVHNWQYQGQ